MQRIMYLYSLCSHYSPEQSSPSTLSTSSNSGRRIPRVNRHLPPHARLVMANRFTKSSGSRAGKYRHQKHHQGGMLMLKNGLILSPSQLMVLNEVNENNPGLSRCPNPEYRGNQLAVVLVDDRSESTNAKKGNLKLEFSESTTPTSSESSSSTSSPSNVRCSSSLKPNDAQNSYLEDKLHR